MVSGTEQGHGGATYPSSREAAMTAASWQRAGDRCRPARLKQRGGMGDMHGLERLMDASSPLSLPRTVALVGPDGRRQERHRQAAGACGSACRSSTPTTRSSARPAARSRSSSSDSARPSSAPASGASSRACSTGPPHVLSTGGGAYMDAETRALMRATCHHRLAARRPRGAVRPRAQAHATGRCCARAIPRKFSRA